MSDLATLRIVVSADNAIRVVDQFGNAVERAATKTERLEQDAGEAKRALDALGNEAKDATRDLVRSSDDIARAAGAIVGAFGATAALVIVDFFGDLIAEQRRAREEMVRTADEWEKQIARMVNAGDVAELTKLAREAFLGTPAEAFRDGVQAQQKLVDDLRAQLNADPIGQLSGVFGGFERLAKEEQELERRLTRFAELRERIADTVNVPFLQYERDPITTTADAPGRASRAGGAGVAPATPFDIDNAEFAQVVGDAIRLLELERQLAEDRINAQARQSLLTGEFAEQIGEGERHVINFGEAVDGLGESVSESERVLTEQLQLGAGRFAREMLDGGLSSLPRVWDAFTNLGKDAIAQVFAKSFMDDIGDNLAKRLSGLLDGALSGLGLAGGGILGVVGAGVAAGLGNIFGQSKWERAAEEHQKAARALEAAAGEMRASMVQSQAQWLDDFLTYANKETPLQRELRSLGIRRNDLARDAFGIARDAGGSLSNQVTALLNAGQFDGNVAALIRRDAEQINQTDLGRQALLDFADALDQLNAALADNVSAAKDATLAQQELTLAQFRDELGMSATERLSPVARLAEAQRQYEALLALARGGDASAVDSLPETARTLLDAARETFASGVRFQDLFTQVQGDIDQLLADVNRQRVENATNGEATTYTGDLDYLLGGVDPNPPAFPAFPEAPADWWPAMPPLPPSDWWGPLTEGVEAYTGQIDYLSAQVASAADVFTGGLGVVREGFETYTGELDYIATLLGDAGTKVATATNTLTEGVEDATVGFDYSVAAPTLDVSGVTAALAAQTDRTLAVANAQLAVAQQGFGLTVKNLSALRSEMGIALAAIEWAIRNGTAPPRIGQETAEPSRVGFDY